MANYPPFMNATGLVSKILDKIKQAQTPDRFTQDFLATKLGFPGGSAKSFIPLAKRIGLLASDGKPTDLYKQFRNPKTSKAAMAAAIKQGYADLYSRNEYAHILDKDGLDGLIMEATGLEEGHQTLIAIRSTFEGLKPFADFDTKLESSKEQQPSDTRDMKSEPEAPGLRLGLTYTINIVLPKTDDIAVFNAIFKSIKENLLK